MNPDKLSEYPASGSTSTFLSMLLQETRLVASKVCVWVGVGVSLVGVCLAKPEARNIRRSRHSETLSLPPCGSLTQPPSLCLQERIRNEKRILDEQTVQVISVRKRLRIRNYPLRRIMAFLHDACRMLKAFLRILQNIKS